jgi:hypothetical protein
MWQVRIDGNAPDLVDIEGALPTGTPLRIRRIGEEHYLSGDQLDQAEDAAAAHRAAREMLDVLNVAARLADSSHRPVAVGPVRDDSGMMHIFAEAHGAWGGLRAFASGVVISDGGPPPPRSRTIAELMFDLSEVSELNEVIGLLLNDRSPVGMYKVYEVIKDQLHAEPDRRQLVSRSELRRFKHSVNDPDAVGGRARHARRRTQPPSHPMDEPEAQAFVDALVRHWIESMAAERGVPLTDALGKDAD